MVVSVDLPTNVSTGMVTGQYIADIIDGADPNQEPDAIPAQGQIVFTKSVPYLPNPVADPNPVTIMQVPIVGVLDAEGYLCTPAPGTLDPVYRGVKLIATDDPDLSVTDWTWDVTYFFEPVGTHKIAIPPHGFSLPAGTTVDLTRVAKVPSSPGYGLPQAEAAVLRAESAAVSAEQSAADALAAALRAESIAGATDAGVASLLVDPDTESGGVLSDKLAPKADVEAMNNALSLKADETALTNGLASKADLVGGKVPVGQLPTDALVTDANVAAVVDGAQTGPAIDARINTQVTPLVQPIVADYIASQPAVVDAAAAAVDANPDISSIKSRLTVLDGQGQRGYTIDQTAGRTVKVWDYLNNREQLIYGDTGARNITALFTGLVGGSVIIRRTAQSVEVDFQAVILPNGSSINFVDLGAAIPTGFKPPRSKDFNIPARTGSESSTIGSARFDATGNVFIYRYTDGEFIRVSAVWMTNDPWPTSLPGVAA